MSTVPKDSPKLKQHVTRFVPWFVPWWVGHLFQTVCCWLFYSLPVLHQYHIAIDWYDLKGFTGSFQDVLVSLKFFFKTFSCLDMSKTWRKILYQTYIFLSVWIPILITQEQKLGKISFWCTDVYISKTKNYLNFELPRFKTSG